MHWAPDFVPTMLIDVSREFPPTLLPRMLRALPSMVNESIRADVLRRMTVLLEPSMLPDCVPALLSITDDDDRNRTMERLLPLVPAGCAGPDRAGTGDRRPVRARALALKVVALHAGVPAEPVLQEALNLVRVVPDGSARGALLCSLVGGLPDRLLPVALQSLRGFENEPSVAEALVLLIPGCRNGTLVTRSRADRFTDDVQRVLVLRRIANAGPVAVLPDALSRVADVRNPFYRAHLIEAFAPRLPAELVPRALSITAAIVNSSARARTIAAIASGSTTTVDESILVSAVDSLAAVADEAYRVTLLGRLVRHAPEALVPSALRVLAGIDDEFIRVDGFRVLLPHIDERSIEAVEDAVRRLRDDHHRAVLYAELSERADPHDGSRLIGTAVATVDAIRDTRARAEAWREIVHRMESPDQLIVERAMSAAFDVGRPLYMVDAIVEFAPLLSESIRAEALRRAKAIKSGRDRVRARRARPYVTLAQFVAVLDAGAALLGEDARLTSSSALRRRFQSCCGQPRFGWRSRAFARPTVRWRWPKSRTFPKA